MLLTRFQRARAHVLARPAFARAGSPAARSANPFFQRGMSVFCLFSPALGSSPFSLVADLKTKRRRMASSAAAPVRGEYSKLPSHDDDARGGSASPQPNTSTSPDDADLERAVDRKNDQPVTWLSLPIKGQLAIILLARLSEPISERSLTAYAFYQLCWFDPALPAADIAYQMGILTPVFAAAQCVTGVVWGRVADALWVGRKGALMVGLGGGCIAAVGVGFSRSFAAMLFFRALCGILNGNVGVMRAMISEITTEKKCVESMHLRIRLTRPQISVPLILATANDVQRRRNHRPSYWRFPGSFNKDSRRRFHSRPPLKARLVGQVSIRASQPRQRIFPPVGRFCSVSWA